MAAKHEVDRTQSWGEDYKLSMMDRFGIWLSKVQILRHVRTFSGKDVGDFGCGYHARFVRSVLDEAQSATVVDLSLADDLKAMPKVRAIQGVLPDALGEVPEKSLDVVICNNVLEHLWEPERVLDHVRRTMRSGGVCFLNVPSWWGKFVLETAAFKLHLTSEDEINDHKRYYDRRELWNLVVRGGFKPNQVVCHSHKFGLNTYA